MHAHTYYKVCAHEAVKYRMHWCMSYKLHTV